MMMIKAQLLFYIYELSIPSRAATQSRPGHTASTLHFAMLRAKGTCDDYDDYLYLRY